MSQYMDSATSSLSLLQRFSFIPKENMLLMTLKFAKFSDSKHNNIRPTVWMGTPLSRLPSYCPPPKSSQTMHRKCMDMDRTRTHWSKSRGWP